MNEKDYWNDARTLILINEIKKYPAIWDKASPDYVDKVKKKICWNKISQEMELPMSLVILKYSRLCQMYHSERHKKHKTSRSYKNICKFFPHLDELIGQDSKRRLVKVSSSIGEEDIYIESSAESEDSVAEDEKEDTKLWNDKKLKQFIDILQKNPILFELNSGSHEPIWKAITNKLDCSVDQAKIQKKTLIVKFNSEYKKYLENPNFKSNWKYIEDLQFLAYQNHLRPQKTKTVKQSIGAANTTQNADDDDEVILSASDNENDTVPEMQVDPLLDDFWNSNKVIELIKLVRSRRVIWDEKNANYTNEAKQHEAWTEIVKQMNIPLKTLKDKFDSLITTYYKIANDTSHVIDWIYFTHMEFLPIPKQVEKERTEFSIEIRNEANVIQETLQEPEACQAQLRDEYTIFGEAVANEMRQMNDFKAIQTNFKNKVLKILLQARETST